MCDRCRWNDHDGCQGWLSQGQRLRCLCRTCLEQRLATPPAVKTDLRTTDRRASALTERAARPGRPKLVLLDGGADTPNQPTAG
ncbi:MAG: hypothetical protein QOC98_3105 [Frankiaceae bacterium]|nr:hypothetical protein [Frankiaceae bacterium]